MNDQWISVEERLPEGIGDYQVKKGDIVEVAFFTATKIWGLDCDTKIKGDITHWKTVTDIQLRGQFSMEDQQKVGLGKALFKIIELPVLFPDETLIKFSNQILNKIQELTQNNENNEPEHQTTPSDNTEVGQYQTTGEKHHVCGSCYQSYPIKELERNFMDCDSCKDTGKERPTCLDKNGKLFTAGDWLKNEKSSQMVQILQIQTNSIAFGNGTGKVDGVSYLQGCIDKQDFINAGWIVHERVTGFEVDKYNNGMTRCKFTDCMIGSAVCRFSCDDNKATSWAQQWVICELYNKEVEGGI